MNAAPTALESEPETRSPRTAAAIRRRRRRIVTTVVVVTVVTVVVGGAGYYMAEDGGGRSKPPTTVPTGTATVTRGTLTARTSVSGTLTYAGGYQAVNQASGVITGLPRLGQVVRQGQVLYRVNGRPVVFLKGLDTPMYRDLRKGMSGPDVRELNAALAASGHDVHGTLSSDSDTYTEATAAAVKSLQDALDVKQTGRLGKGDVVFIGVTRIRVTALQARLGGPAQPGGVVLTGSSTRRQVNVDVDASLQERLKEGQKVVITLPSGADVKGSVSSVGTVVKKGQGGRSTVSVAITPADSKATGGLDRAPVGVSITTESVEGALMVPVNALLALLGGGYGIEVVDADGSHHLVPVTLGLFDDTAGNVQITGKGVVPGQKVVVPTS
ncbi:efflux RND transporter periplasmic adaptor subunit [Actinomadura logoneensis]|uniref:Efflux RND transporter periplasmic adaptor subunit n=1 Tax=Actinomadura logoneensis TaxID=2293572 RepID=A0A372JM45_9ACTN|nr:peptidoglycan-binding protein [Actinomadura logoneensis]RFU41030.1 efflux RND transporter periplasmic adaptor subunit [Actinomadura logoneensis]